MAFTHTKLFNRGTIMMKKSVLAKVVSVAALFITCGVAFAAGKYDDWPEKDQPKK